MYVVGRFNIIERGYSWRDREFSEVIICEYDNNEREVARKLFYFKGRVPKFETERQVDAVFKYPGNSKLCIASGLFIRRVA